MKNNNITDRILDKILIDQTTKENILWANGRDGHITKADVASIHSRSEKDIETKTKRTKQRAEVFTPSWLCNKMNNCVDEAWFGEVPKFNQEFEKGWGRIDYPIPFLDKTWQEYVLNKRLEITCGEAPFLVSRYDSVSGEDIYIKDRIGLLDRKLRVISENVDDEQEWIEWVFKAYQNIYGYEYQGDNLFLARKNLLLSFVDYTKDKFGHEPSKDDLETIAEIISWNIWQMDGLKYCVPEQPEILSKVIMDWDSKEVVAVKSIAEEE